jgi:anaerobic selenocysteine-containing dehydrogenase
VGKEFDWENEQDAFDEILKPSGLTFEKFKEAGQINSKKVFRQYETKGFETPSGKIEIYSKRLEKWGYDSLPTYYEPPETPYSDSALVKKYPFILTCWKPEDYRHSWGHQIPSLRLNHPDPIVVIHPDAAARLSIREGDWVLIETERGTVRQKAKLDADLDERVVVAEFGWWYPERNNLNESGWEESNINVLTDDRTPYNRAMGAANEMGTPTLSGFCCNVHK